MASLERLIKASILDENFPMTLYSYSDSATIKHSGISNESSLEQQDVHLRMWNGTAASLVSGITPPNFFFLEWAEQEHSIDLNLSFRLFFYTLYALIFLIGVVGNFLVCYVVFRQSTMQTVTNVFIANLALSDILLCVFCVPFTPLYLLTFKEWVFGSLFCHLVPFAQGVSVYISVFTLMSIALERYAVIVHPFRHTINISSCIAIILIIWTLAFIFTLPYGIFIEVISMVYISPKLSPRNETTEGFNSSREMAMATKASPLPQGSEAMNDYLRSLMQMPKIYCHEMWPSDTLRLAFGLSTTVIQFIVPFCIISFCYYNVYAKLWDRIRTRPGSRNCSTQRKWLEKERARRTNSMLISMVIIFVVSWLPLNTYNLIEDVYVSTSQWKHSKTLFVTFHLIAMSSTCYNPFLYAWLNDNFRKEFKSIFLPVSTRLRFLSFGQGDTDASNKELRNKGVKVLGQSAIGLSRKTENSTNPANNNNNYTRTTELKGMTGNNKEEEDGDCEISMTMLDTTTNLVTNLESINEIELQESLLVTSVRNGALANRVLMSAAPPPVATINTTNQL